MRRFLSGPSPRVARAACASLLVCGTFQSAARAECKDVRYKSEGTGGLMRSTDCEDAASPIFPILSCLPSTKPAAGQFHGLHAFRVTSDRSMGVAGPLKNGLLVELSFGNAQSRWLFEVSRAAAERKRSKVDWNFDLESVDERDSSKGAVRKSEATTRSVHVVFERQGDGSLIPETVTTSTGLRIHCGGGTADAAGLEMFK